MRLRSDDIAGLVALALQVAAVVLIYFAGTSPALYAQLLAVAAMIYSRYASLQARREAQARNEQRMALLGSTLKEFDQHSDDAMTFAQEQFHLVRTYIDQSYEIINNATGKLTGSLTGLKENSVSQMELLKQLVESLVQAASGTQQKEQIAGIKRFAQDTESIVGELIGFMSKVGTASKDTDRNYARVEELMKSIVQFLNNVSEVTKQTDLLALNAAIEAARAG